MQSGLPQQAFIGVFKKLYPKFGVGQYSFGSLWADSRFQQIFYRIPSTHPSNLSTAPQLRAAVSAVIADGIAGQKPLDNGGYLHIIVSS